jgi:hypothetical protein
MQMHRSQLRSWWSLYYRKTATFLKFEISDVFFFFVVVVYRIRGNYNGLKSLYQEVFLYELIDCEDIEGSCGSDSMRSHSCSYASCLLL